ncbi:MAG: aminodeoxychorismate synthase component I [Spirochaetota bacterium]|nr:aminodeoxychorismate synthase component I [Spirochaetota bacterium]
MQNNNNFFFFETNRYDKDNYRSYYFTNPIKTIRLVHPEDLNNFFDELEDLTKRYYVAGFFSYELGFLLEEAFKNNNKKITFPYAFFCAYKNPAIFDHNLNRFTSGSYDISKEIPDYKVSNLKLNVTDKEYKDNIETIRDFIHKGDIYQANYTIKYNFDISGSPLGLYNDLKRKQNVAYNVFARFDDYYILSLSPELFFNKQEDRIVVKPMKGTYKRGRNLVEDRMNSAFLENDEKNRSENIMIVDLLRNDIGKMSIKGSVRAIRLYEIEKYNTLFQMTSTIESRLLKDIPIYEFIKSIFPSGSITGAPKIRSMEIIDMLEKEERKIYTGSLGFFKPSGDSIFNVAIRTILINNNKGEMGIGGGIVYDSDPDDEFSECKLKARFLVEKPIDEFCLIETILFDKNYKLLGLHLKRLKESADYFNFKFNSVSYLLLLNKTSSLLIDGRYRVRTLLHRSGEVEISYSKLDIDPINFITAISEYRTNSNDIFFFHKTTNRELYNSELKKARDKGFFDMIFINEKDEVTEGSITNIYAKINGIIFTPPVECGLLNGAVRQYLIMKRNVKEKILTLEELKDADALFISNSIIGFRRIELSVKD